MKKSDKNFKLYITHSLELLFWLIIILIIVAISTVKHMSNIQEDNDYTIFMNDVDGLIVGSPVRMMGIEVGHITKIKPTNEEIYVKFIITDKSILLPQGTIATVEFSGMAGSKSLELYLPDKDRYIDQQTPILTVESPKRLHDAVGLLNDMFDKIGSIIYTSTSFGKQVKFIELPKRADEDAAQFLEYADKMVDQTNIKVNNFNKKLKTGGFNNAK